jgi:hypothetical protein
VAAEACLTTVAAETDANPRSRGACVSVAAEKEAAMRRLVCG